MEKSDFTTEKEDAACLTVELPRNSKEFELGDKISVQIDDQRILLECNSFHDMKCKNVRKRDYCFSDITGNLRLTYTNEEKTHE